MEAEAAKVVVLPVSPLLQTTDPLAQLVALTTTISPTQKALEGEPDNEIVGGEDLSITSIETVFEDSLSHPFSVHVADNDSAETAVNEIVLPVEPLLQFTVSPQPVAFNCTVSPTQ